MHACVVVDFGKKLEFFGIVTFKHGIINDKIIGTIFGIQWNDGIFDDPGGKDRCETNPVNRDHLHKTIHSILCKSRSAPSCDQYSGMYMLLLEKIGRNRY